MIAGFELFSSVNSQLSEADPKPGMLDILVYLLLQHGFGVICVVLAAPPELGHFIVNATRHSGTPRQFPGRLPITGHPDGLL